MSSSGRKRKADDTESSIQAEDNTSSMNNYTGWIVPSNNYIIPTINIDSINPETFYTDYIKQRRPVVLKGRLSDVTQIEQWKDINYLDTKVGDQQVSVEKRIGTDSSFGKGNEVEMSFSKFLNLIKDGDDKHYLTTQDVHADDDGRPELMSPLMQGLQQDFPLRPTLMGNLVPQNINMWAGNNKDGASSGLHHDYHDNLYIVLKGKKRFRLYSPIDTDKMYTRGELLKVHSNGRINYKGEETTAYGADLHSDAAALAARKKDKAEKMLADAECALEQGKAGAQEQVEEAEELLELAMDAVLEAEMADADDEDESEDKEYELFGDKKRLVDKTVKYPKNFSKVDANLLNDEAKLKESHPDILKANTAFCTVESGSMLFLPASWFHEVTSFGTSEGHLAMNYWFHPPDGESFDSPYSSDFWPNDYQDRFDDEKKKKESDAC